MPMNLHNLAARPIVALLAFADWALVLVGAIGAVRVYLVLTGQKAPNGFPAGVPHGGDRYWRLNRAHLNTLENLPVFATIVLGGAALGVSSPRLAELAEAVVLARVLQSAFHIASGGNVAVNLRFVAFLTQLLCFGGMIAETLHLAAS